MKTTNTRHPVPPPLTLALAFHPAALTAALVDQRGRLVAQAKSAPKFYTTRAVIAALVELIIELAHTPARGAAEINAIGIALPGQLDPQSQRVTIPAWKNWARVPLGELLEQALNKAGYDIRQPGAATEAVAETRLSGHPPVTIRPRAVALAAAESWVGAARGKQHVVYLGLSETIESGILIGGQALLGADGVAGAAGWLALGDNFKRDYETQGCLTSEGAPGALVRRAIEEFGGDTRSMLGSLIMETPGHLTPEMIVRAARGGESHAHHVVTAHCRWLGRGMANLISLFNPEALLLGGEWGGALTPFLDEIREEARLWALPEAARRCKILAATIENHAELIGAARLTQT
ncbi:MAG: ROK family protein [Acidobacteria bacterium]|nr:ROK family protein [Acidobacteriota bacterium]MBI3422299.1 ROK family protein [Acidobacteriota bacterium]